MTNDVVGVLPYIAPEVLRSDPYTKQSEVYSLSMIMWELTSGKPPFSDYRHDLGLALSVIDGLRPEIIEGTSNFYANDYDLIQDLCYPLNGFAAKFGCNFTF